MDEFVDSASDKGRVIQMPEFPGITFRVLDEEEVKRLAVSGRKYFYRELALVILDIVGIIAVGFAATLNGILLIPMNNTAMAPMPDPLPIVLIVMAVGLFVTGGVCCVLRHMPRLLREDAPGMSEAEESVFTVSAYGSALLFMILEAGGVGHQVLNQFAGTFSLDPFPAWSEWMLALILGFIVVSKFVGLLMRKPCFATLALATTIAPVLVIIVSAFVMVLIMMGIMGVIGVFLLTMFFFVAQAF